MEYYHEKVQLTNRIPAMIAFLDHENIKQYFPKGAIIPEHWHRSLEVSWIQDAIVNVRSGQNERTICNDFTCINSGVVHSLSASQITESSKCTVVLISYDFIKSYYPEIDEVTFDLSLKENHDDLKRLYVRLSKLYQNQNEYTYLHVTACLLEIIALLLETYSVDKHSIKGKTSKYQKQIKQILGYLQEHYQEPLTLSSVANQFHMSKEHFLDNSIVIWERRFMNTWRIIVCIVHIMMC